MKTTKRMNIGSTNEAFFLWHIHELFHVKHGSPAQQFPYASRVAFRMTMKGVQRGGRQHKKQRKRFPRTQKLMKWLFLLFPASETNQDYLEIKQSTTLTEFSLFLVDVRYMWLVITLHSEGKAFRDKSSFWNFKVLKFWSERTKIGLLD